MTRRVTVRILVGAALVAAAAAAHASPGPGVDPPAGPGALAPNLVADDGGALLTWLEPVGGADRGAYRLQLSRFDGAGWSEPVTITQGDDLFVNWADVPSVVRGGDGALVAHWLQKSGEGTYAYDVMLARSTDGGRAWTPLGPAHDDGTQTEHGFVSLVAEGGGVRAFWLDGREMAGADDDAGEHAGEMMLRTALITERVGESVRLDARVCECCNTSAVMTDGGPLIVYRDRSAEEVRDIFLVRRDGRHWTRPRALATDGWTIPACPVNGPALDASGSDLVAAWFTGAAGRERVRATFSSDAGRTFGAPIEVDPERAMGRVDVVLLSPTEAIVSWLDSGLGAGSVMLRRVDADGRQGRPWRVAPSGVSRRAGFPRLVRLTDGLLLVWTQDTEPTQVRAMTVHGADVPALEPAAPDG